MFRYFHIATFALFASLPLPVMAQSDANARYNECTRSVSVDAEAAYKTARAWYGQTRAMSAQHCMALALFELKNYKEAATTLDDIVSRVPASQGALWLNMKAQAAKAHLSAGDTAAAKNHLDEGLLWAVDKNLDVEAVPLLIQRAALYEQEGKHLMAVQDLDHALEIVPSNPVLLQRANIYLKLGMKDAARKDAEFVLKQEPRNEAALTLLARTSAE